MTENTGRIGQLLQGVMGNIEKEQVAPAITEGPQKSMVLFNSIKDKSLTELFEVLKKIPENRLNAKQKEIKLNLTNSANKKKINDKTWNIVNDDSITDKNLKIANSIKEVLAPGDKRPEFEKMLFLAKSFKDELKEKKTLTQKIDNELASTKPRSYKKGRKSGPRGPYKKSLKKFINAQEG